MSYLDPSMLSIMLGAFARKRGYWLASREIKNLTQWKVPLSEIENGRDSTPLKEQLNQRTHDHNSFKGGWWDRWRELGEADLTDGVCRSLLFDNDAYDIGWFKMALHRKKQGWDNAQLTRDFERLHLRYLKPRT